MPTPDVMVEVEGLRKKFSSAGPLARLRSRRPADCVEVLRGIDLEIHEGDFVALLGANGVGKTTVMKTIATLLHPDSGTVTVLGHDSQRHEKRVREAVGYVMADERSFHWRLSGPENLEFFAKLDGIGALAGRERIAHLLSRLDLSGAGERPFGQFSTGMKQRLSVARALLKRPRVLLMDEPTRSIDPAHAAEVWRLVREEMEAVSGCLIVVTHQIQEALSLCSRVAILASGQIVLNTSARSMERYAADLDGFTVSVRGLAQGGLEQLRTFQGIRDVRVASQVSGEQVLEVSTHNGDLALAGFLGEITGMGGTICSLQRATPLQGVVERLLSGEKEAVL
jgi:ABC-2 type transport system ATP-binding protein